MALAVRYDEIKTTIPALPDPPAADTDTSKVDPPKNDKDDDAIPGIGNFVPRFNVVQHNRTLDISVNGRAAGFVQVFDLSGKIVTAAKLTENTMKIELPANLSGIYLVKVGAYGMKKIAVK